MKDRVRIWTQVYVSLLWLRYYEYRTRKHKAICHSDLHCLATLNSLLSAVWSSCLSKVKFCSPWTLHSNHVPEQYSTHNTQLSHWKFVFTWLVGYCYRWGCLRNLHFYLQIKIYIIFLVRRESRQQWTFQQHASLGKSRRVWYNYWCWLPYSRAALLFLPKLRYLQSYLWRSHLPRRHNATLSEISKSKKFFA